MGKVDRTLGRELRRSRIARGDTLESLASKLGVSTRRSGNGSEASDALRNEYSHAQKVRSDRGMAGSECWQRAAPARRAPEANDRIARASEHPGSDRRVREKGIEDVCERELMAVFRAFAVDERNTILEILQLVLAKLASDS